MGHDRAFFILAGALIRRKDGSLAWRSDATQTLRPLRTRIEMLALSGRCWRTGAIITADIANCPQFPRLGASGESLTARFRVMDPPGFG